MNEGQKQGNAVCVVHGRGVSDSGTANTWEVDKIRLRQDYALHRTEFELTKIQGSTMYHVCNQRKHITMNVIMDIYGCCGCITIGGLR